MKAVFSVFSKTYLINNEPISIKGKTGKEFITSFEKSPKIVEESLIVFINNTPINIASPATEYWSDDTWCNGEENCNGRQKKTKCFETSLSERKLS